MRFVFAEGLFVILRWLMSEERPLPMPSMDAGAEARVRHALICRPFMQALPPTLAAAIRAMVVFYFRLFLQFDRQAAFTDRDIVDPCCKRLPETFIAVFVDEIDVLKVPEPGIGHGHAP